MKSEDASVAAEAVAYVREHADELVAKFANGDSLIVKGQAISFFLAGSPGAGKTETTKLILKDIQEKSIVRIDPDLIRNELPHYKPGNAHLLQQATTIAVDKLYNHAIKKNKSLIFDSTFAVYEHARQNISKSLKKNRIVQILYIYQDPLICWEFTQAREKTEGRNIPKEAFIDRFFGAKGTVDRIKQEFNDRIKVDLIEHNLKTGTLFRMEQDIQSIDKYITIHYTKEHLMKVL